MTKEFQKSFYGGRHNLNILDESQACELVNSTWESLTSSYQKVYDEMSPKYMARTELSFHDQVKLLGYLCIETYHLPGDVLEIGVWKGKSLALLERLSPRNTKIIGVDPCEIEGQRQELREFIIKLIPNAIVLVNYSERAVKDVTSNSQAFKILHIDGGHLEHHVWTDFLLYSKFMVKGGYVIFDDYNDEKHSPEVKIAVDDMFRKGLFNGFNVIGVIKGFESSFVLQKL